MARDLSLDLLRPAWLTPAAARRVVEALLGAGFALASGPGEPQYFYRRWDRDSDIGAYRRLEEPLALLDDDGYVSLRLWTRRLDGEVRDVSLALERGAARLPHSRVEPSMDMVHLWTNLGSGQPDRLLSLEFLGWAAFLAGLTQPWRGEGGGEEGLLWRWEFVDGPEPSAAALEPPWLAWLTILGPPYLERLGLEAALGAPAWRVEALAGGVAVVLAPHPDDVTAEAAGRVADHLGLAEPAWPLSKRPPDWARPRPERAGGQG
jgi:hypothetical protein